MKPFAVFCDSFLDGFTLSGFMTRLEQPGAPTRMFAPEPMRPASDWEPVVFEPAFASTEAVEIAGNLHGVPEKALHAMMEMLRREDESRKTTRQPPDGAVHGTSR